MKESEDETLPQLQTPALSESQKLWALFSVGLGVFMSTLDVGISVMGAVFAALSASVGGTDVAVAPSSAIVAGFQGTFRLAAFILCGAALASAFRFGKIKDF